MENEIEITSEDVDRWLHKVSSVIISVTGKLLLSLRNYSKKVLRFLSDIEDYIAKCNECNKRVYSNIQYNGKRVCMKCMKQMLKTEDNYNIPSVKNSVNIETGTRIHNEMERLFKAVKAVSSLPETNTNTPMPSVKPPPPPPPPKLSYRTGLAPVKSSIKEVETQIRKARTERTARLRRDAKFGIQDTLNRVRKVAPKTISEKLFRLSKKVDGLADEYETPVGVHNRLHDVAIALREMI